MTSLYSENVKRLWDDCDWPKGLNVYITEDELNLWLIFFRKNLNQFSKVDQRKIAEVAKTFLEAVTRDGIPIRTAVEPGRDRNDP